MKPFKSVFILTAILVTTFAYSAEYRTADMILKEYGLFKPDMSAQDYNVAGFLIYQKKNYEDASTVFYEAIEKDDNHVLAHYNYACTLSLMYKTDREKVTPAEIFHHLYTSISLDKSRRQKALKDSDFDPVRSMMDFKVVTADPDKPIIEEVRLKYKGVGAVEYDLSVYFEDSNGNPYSFSDNEGVFSKAGLYSSKVNEAGFPEYSENDSKVGNYYDVTFKWDMAGNGWSGMVHATRVVILIV